MKKKRKLLNKSPTTSEVDYAQRSKQGSKNMEKSKRQKNVCKKRNILGKKSSTDEEESLQGIEEGMSCKRRRKVNQKEIPKQNVEKDEAPNKKASPIRKKRQCFNEQTRVSFNVVTRSSAKKQLVQADKQEQLVNSPKNSVENDVSSKIKVEFTENVGEIVAAPEMVPASKMDSGFTTKSQKNEFNYIDCEYRESFKYGWRRKIVSCDQNLKNEADDCYYNPRDIKLKSRPKRQQNLINGLTMESDSYHIEIIDIADSDEDINPYSKTVTAIMKNQEKKRKLEFPEISDVRALHEDIIPTMKFRNLDGESSIDNKANSIRNSEQIIVQVEVHNDPSSVIILSRQSDTEKKLELQNKQCKASNKIDIPEINFPCKMTKFNKIMSDLDNEPEIQIIMPSEDLSDIYKHHAELHNSNKEIFKTESENKKNDISILEEKLEKTPKIIINSKVEKNIASENSPLVGTSTSPIERNISVISKEDSNLLKDDEINIIWDRNKDYESKEIKNEPFFNEVTTSKFTEDLTPNKISNSRTSQNVGEEFKEVVSIDTTLHSNINFSSTKSFSSYHNASLDISNADEKINNDNQKIIQVMDFQKNLHDCSTIHTEELTKKPFTETEDIHSTTLFTEIEDVCSATPFTETKAVHGTTPYVVQTCESATDVTRNASQNVDHTKLNSPQEVIDHTHKTKDELIQKVCSQSYTLSYENNVETAKSKTIEINRLDTLPSENNIYHNEIKVENLQDNFVSTKCLSNESVQDVSVFRSTSVITKANETSISNQNICPSEICKHTALETSNNEEIKSLNIVDYINSFEDESLQATDTVSSNTPKPLPMGYSIISMNQETSSSCKSSNIKIKPNITIENTLLNMVSTEEIKSTDLQDSNDFTRSCRDNSVSEVDLHSNNDLKPLLFCPDISTTSISKSTNLSEILSENDKSAKHSNIHSNVCTIQSARNAVEEEIDFYSNKILENATLQAVTTTAFQNIVNENQIISKNEQSRITEKYIDAEIDGNSSDLEVTQDEFQADKHVLTESEQKDATLASRISIYNSTSASSDILTEATKECNIGIMPDNTSDSEKDLVKSVDNFNINFTCEESYGNDCMKKLELTSNGLSNEKPNPNVYVAMENQQNNILIERNNSNSVNTINLLPPDINFDLKSEDQMCDKKIISESAKIEEFNPHYTTGRSLLSTIQEDSNTLILPDNLSDDYSMENSVTLTQNNIINTEMQKKFSFHKSENTFQDNNIFVQENSSEKNLIDCNIPLVNTSSMQPLQSTTDQHEQNFLTNLDIKYSVKTQEIYNLKKIKDDTLESLNDDVDSIQGFTDVSSVTVNSPVDSFLYDEQSSSTGEGKFSITDESNERIEFNSNNHIRQEHSLSNCNISSTAIKLEDNNIDMDTDHGTTKLHLNENETPITHLQNNEIIQSSGYKNSPKVGLIANTLTDNAIQKSSDDSCPLAALTESNLIQNSVCVNENSSSENEKNNHTFNAPLESQWSYKSTTSELQELKKILESTLDEDDFYEETYNSLVNTNINSSDPENIFQIKKYLKDNLHNDSQTSILSESDGNVSELVEYNVNSSNTTPIEESTPLKQNYSSNERPLISTYPHSMASFCSSYSLLKYIFKYLSFKDLLVARQVCRVWKEIVDQPLLWKKVQIKNNQMINILENTLQNHKTEHLVVIDEDCDNWEIFINTVSKLNSLRVLELCPCPAHVLETVTENCPRLEIISAQSIKSDSINIEFVKNLNDVKKIELRAATKMSLQGNLTCLLEFSNLMYLSLRSVKDLGKKNIKVIKDLKSIQILELGECSEFSSTFGSTTLIELKNLKRLRLEKVQNSSCITDILTSVSKLNNLTDLELVNIDVTNGFGRCLPKCHNIRKLMVIPVYEQQLALSNNIILKTIPKLSISLEHFVWGITEELLQFSKAIYEYPDGDSIPVLKPIPYLTFLEKSNITGNARDKKKSVSTTSELDMLPLSNLQKFYSIFLPTTQVDILRVKISETWNLNM